MLIKDLTDTISNKAKAILNASVCVVNCRMSNVTPAFCALFPLDDLGPALSIFFFFSRWLSLCPALPQNYEKNLGQ